MTMQWRITIWNSYLEFGTILRNNDIFNMQHCSAIQYHEAAHIALNTNCIHSPKMSLYRFYYAQK